MASQCNINFPYYYTPSAYKLVPSRPAGAARLLPDQIKAASLCPVAGLEEPPFGGIHAFVPWVVSYVGLMWLALSNPTPVLIEWR